tara:strand:+ start:1560 stop:1772 length:213 start_codon:yes stop_codon:yes gene_type:complete
MLAGIFNQLPIPNTEIAFFHSFRLVAKIDPQPEKPTPQYETFLPLDETEVLAKHSENPLLLACGIVRNEW